MNIAKQREAGRLRQIQPATGPTLKMINAEALAWRAFAEKSLKAASGITVLRIITDEPKASHHSC